MTVPVGLNAPVRDEVSCAWVPSAIGPAGEMTVETVGAFAPTESGSEVHGLVAALLFESPLYTACQ